MNDKELIEQNRLEAEAWMVAADNCHLVDDLANFRKGAIAAASLCRLNASRLEALAEIVTTQDRLLAEWEEEWKEPIERAVAAEAARDHFHALCEKVLAYARAITKERDAFEEQWYHDTEETIPGLRSSLARAQEEIEGLRRDEARLDWIESTIRQHSDVWLSPCGVSLRFVQVRRFGDCENYPTAEGLRAAIDAAIAGDPK